MKTTAITLAPSKQRHINCVQTFKSEGHQTCVNNVYSLRCLKLVRATKSVFLTALSDSCCSASSSSASTLNSRLSDLRVQPGENDNLALAPLLNSAHTKCIEQCVCFFSALAVAAGSARFARLANKGARLARGQGG